MNSHTWSTPYREPPSFDDDDDNSGATVFRRSRPAVPYSHYAPNTFSDRLWQPSVVLPTLLLGLYAAYHLYARHYKSRRPSYASPFFGYYFFPGLFLPSAADVAWHLAVALIPAAALYALDRWLNPPLLPIPMLLQGSGGGGGGGVGTGVMGSVVGAGRDASHAAKSDLLAKILGLDAMGPGGGAGTAFAGSGRGGSLATRSSGSSGGALAFGRKLNADTPPGLGNWDNSCYQNSILQGLAALKPLPAYLASPFADGEDASAGGAPALAPGRLNSAAAETLRNLIADLNDEANYGKTLWTPQLLKSMSTWQQQDAQEYLTKLLDDIDRDVAKAVRARQRPLGLEAGGSVAAQERQDQQQQTPPQLNQHAKSDAASSNDAGSQHSDDSGYQSLSTVLSKGGSSGGTSSTSSSAGGVASPSSSSSSAAATANVRLPAPPRNPLDGLLAQRVACVECGHSEGLSMIPFNCLTLSLDVEKTEFNLYERLDAYARVEYIPGVFCAKCTLLKLRRLLAIVGDRARAAGQPDDRIAARLAAVDAALDDDDFDERTVADTCAVPNRSRVASTKTKQAVVARPPQSLAVHVNRSVFDENTGRMFKNSAPLRFPLILDLGPWCLGSAGGDATATDAAAAAIAAVRGPANNSTPTPTSSTADEGAQHLVSPSDGEQQAAGSNPPDDEEQWLLDPTASMVAGDARISKISGPIYELRAVVTHMGRHENGHYVCYRRQPRRRQSPPAESPAKTSSSDEGPQEPDAAVDLDAGGKSDHHHHHLDSETPDPDGYDWWRLSDETVYRVDEDVVLAQGGVFMLFYDCLDPNSVLTSPHLHRHLVDESRSEEEDEEEEGTYEDAVADAASSDAHDDGSDDSTDSAETAPSSTRSDEAAAHSPPRLPPRPAAHTAAADVTKRTDRSDIIGQGKEKLPSTKKLPEPPQLLHVPEENNQLLLALAGSVPLPDDEDWDLYDL